MWDIKGGKRGKVFSFPKGKKEKKGKGGALTGELVT